MAEIQEDVMARAFVPALLLVPFLAGCVEVDSEKDMAPEEKPVLALKRLGSEDPALAAKLELDPSVQSTWWSRKGRWDDPSRRIVVDWGPLTLVVYPTSILELPALLIAVPTSIVRPLSDPPESDKMKEYRRIAEERAEKAFPADDRTPR
jgi:hypothetical protein